MSSRAALQPGRLFYVMGASGAGKDFLLKALARVLPDDAPVHIARRTITRAVSESESHLPVSREEFERRVEAGEFALHWEAHGRCYGIEQAIRSRLEQGQDIIVNGSRAYYDRAFEKFGECLVPVLVDVPDSVLEARLMARGRESAEEVQARLERHREMKQTLPARIMALDNSGSVEQTALEFLDLITKGRSHAIDVSRHG